MDDRLAVGLVRVPGHHYVTALQGGAGDLLRQNRIYIVRNFLDNHGVGPPAIFVLKTIISHFATFVPQMQKKFHEQFVIIRSKQGE